jgi:hypothetical protein
VVRTTSRSETPTATFTTNHCTGKLNPFKQGGR